MDALEIEQAVLAGYDWGGRAANVVAALWPERATGLVTGAGYNIQNVAASIHPAPPQQSIGTGTSTTFTPQEGEQVLKPIGLS